MQDYRKFSIHHYCLASFLMVGMLSSVFAAAPAKSLAKLVPFCIGGYLFYRLTTGNWNQDRLLKLTKMLVIGAFILSIIGCAQYLYALIKGASGLNLRVTSLTTHPNALAKFVLPFIPIVLTFAIINSKIQTRSFYIVVAITMVAVEMFTISRGAWIGMAVSSILLIMLFRSYKVLAAIVCLSVVCIVLLPPEIGLERFYSIFSLTHQWNIERINVWNASLAMIKDHPILGLGLNNFQYYYLAYMPPHGVEIFQHAHNTLLNIAVETGLLGFGFFTVFLGSVLCEIFSSRLESANQYLTQSIGIGIIGLLTFGMVEYNFNNEAQIILFFLLLAIAIKSKYEMKAFHHKDGTVK